jgi:hypothetical protein
MIIIKLFGGLGNQLFQYALGRHLSIKSALPLFLDAESGFQNDFYKRTYSLHVFHIQAQLLDRQTIQVLQRFQNPLGRRDKLKNWIDKHFKGINPTFISEKHYQFDVSILSQDIKPMSCFSGYWQTEKYFKSIENTIRQDLTFKEEIPEKNQWLAEEIQQKNSVCLHVRRLLGIAEGKINEEGVKFHGSIDYPFYQKAIDLIAKRQENLHFYIFGDVIDWAKENLNLSFPHTFIEGNLDYQDLQLMSLCKYHIIPNSTFAWWSAWLNPNPQKIVVAPDAWFADKAINTQDIYPESWIRI